MDKNRYIIFLLFLIITSVVISLIFNYNIEKFDNTTPIEISQMIPSITDIKHVIKNVYVRNSNIDEDNGGVGRYLNVYMNNGTNKFKPLGQYMELTKTKSENIPKSILSMEPIKMTIAGGRPPRDYYQIWNSSKMDDYEGVDFSIWRVVPFEGYKAMGDIFKLGFDKPDINYTTTLPDRVLTQSGNLKKLVWAIDYNDMNIHTPVIDSDGYGEDDDLRDNNKNLFCWYVTNYYYPKCYRKKYTSTTPRHDIEDIMNIKNTILENGGEVPEKSLKIKLSTI